MGLFDMVMIKDNHISAAGGIINAIRSVDEYLGQKNLQMEVEVILIIVFRRFKILKSLMICDVQINLI